MELPQLSEVQFQASAQSKAFDPLQLPDPNPQLSQNLSIIQQSFSNLAQSGRINAAADYTSDPTFMEQFAELLPKAMETAIQVQNVDVAIQMARADDQYYQMLNQGLIKPSEELQNVIKNEKTKESTKWIDYIITRFLMDGAVVQGQDELLHFFKDFQFNHVCNGELLAQGEDPDDR